MPIGNQAKMVVHIYNDLGTTLCGHPLNDVHWAIADQEKERATCARCRAAANLPVDSQNYLERIDAIYAVLSQDEGGEGVVSGMLRDGTLVPLIAADETRLKELLPYAHQLSDALNVRMKLVKFTSRQELEDVVPLVGSKIPGSP